jgi:hypothetical protein
VGIPRDFRNPELVVLGGQALTEAPNYLGHLLIGFAAGTTLPGTELIGVTRFGLDVQAMAACTGLLAGRSFTATVHLSAGDSQRFAHW